MAQSLAGFLEPRDPRQGPGLRPGERWQGSPEKWSGGGGAGVRGRERRGEHRCGQGQ